MATNAAHDGRRWPLAAVLPPLLGSLSFAISVDAADGYFDTTWVGGGRIAFEESPYFPNNPSYVRAVLADSGGNTLLFGSTTPSLITLNSSWLGQVLPNGQFVPSFGASDATGRITGCQISSSLCDDKPLAVAIQRDGRYVVAGVNYLFRTTVNASALDIQESSLVTVNDVGGKVLAQTLAMQSGTKILAAGRAYYSPVASKDVFGVMRLGSDMLLDTGFGAMKDAQQTTFAGGALVNVSAADSAEEVENILVQPDGMIVLAGIGNPGLYIETARFTADGLLDTSYGNNGAARLSWSQGSIITNTEIGTFTSSVMDSAGRVVIAATAVTTAFGIQGMLVTRLDSTGSVDTSFGDAFGGPGVSFNFNFQSQCTKVVAHGLAVDSAGRILVVGTCYNTASGPTYFAVERLRGDGTLDTSFGVGGFSLGTYANSYNSNVAFSVAFDASGHPIVAGGTGPSSVVASGAARLTYDLIYTSGFETAPRGCLPPDCN